MSKTKSNDNGRAFEFIITKKLSDLGATLSNHAKQDQQRDLSKIPNLDNFLKLDMEKASNSIILFLQNEGIDIKNSTVDRLTDDVAKKGDVTDIIVKDNNNRINLSIKNNHKATKHPRPGSIPSNWLNLGKKGYISEEFNEKYKEINDNFIQKMNDENHQFTTFKELKEIDNDFINKNLYAPICNLSVDTLNLKNNDKDASKYLFEFLTGTKNFYKIINLPTKNYIEIMDFTENKIIPTSFIAKKINDSYISIEFSNGWVFQLRLHTASSRIAEKGKKQSLKFDCQLIKSPIQIKTIKK